MAKKPSSKITRITASDNGEKKTLTNSKTKVKKIDAKPVTRVTASDTVTKKVKKTITTQQSKTVRRSPLKRITGYFKGAWYELRQVRWPNRANTWSMTGALLAFTAFFLALIVALDTLFKYLFQLILGA